MSAPLLSTRGALLRAGLALPFLLSRSRAGEAFAWAPPQRLGMNISAGAFWGRQLTAADITLWQGANLGWIRHINPGLSRPSFQDPAVADWAAWTATAVRRASDDASVLELLCDDLVYAPPTGERVVLSAAVTYTPLAGPAVVLPAGTPLTILGGTAGLGVFTSGAWRFTSPGYPGVLRLSAGSAIGDAGTQTVSAGVLHTNWYRQGTTPRTPIAAIKREAEAWMNAGFGYVWCGTGSSWKDLYDVFGRDTLRALRQQEWEWVAAQGWPTSLMAVADENEPNWGDDSAAWLADWRDWVYPQMRGFFPAHSLLFRQKSFARFLSTAEIEWWPRDGNTAIETHIYLDGVIDTTSQATMEAALAWAEAARTRLGASRIIGGEWGYTASTGSRAAKTAAAVGAFNTRSWTAAVWAGAQSFQGYTVASIDSVTGKWRIDVPEAFGLA